MSWVRSVKFAAAALSGAGLLPLSTAASAAIVVASSGPSAAQFPAGRKLDDASRITLQSGDSVTVLDQRGTKVIRGPGRFSVSQPGRPLPNPAFAVLTRDQAAGRARTGAVRTGEDGKPISPNLWFVDISRPGTTCITDPGDVRFWRADDEKPATYELQPAQGAISTVVFDAGSGLARWNAADKPLADGAAVTLSRRGGAEVGAFSFALLPSPPREAEALAAALIEKGCTAQLDLLSQTLRIPRF